MIRIAVLEDEEKEVEKLESFLARFESENGEKFTVTAFSDAINFLTDYRAEYDMVFMDIEMPFMNGIDAAKRLREVDPIVALVFITNMEQLAVKGYEVDAIDFVVKPINYYRFSAMLKKVVREVKKNEEKEIIVSSATKITRLRISQVYYVEIRDHLLIYHTEKGNFEMWGNLKDVENELTKYNFVRSSSAFLVNLKHVMSVDGDTVLVANEKVPISQRKRKDFFNSVTDYLGGNK